ncbi:outer membrane protein assembly factor BamE [Luteimonas sp. 8-5]|uniref:outer membrane protein assembly factor BamE n=1 Tax=Luteimonas sp. 8-5 TaxID=3039387 RepID=UPI0024363C85|nr:outer membrane protein assembly factor BamE [Luteimonas sp. 8-5]MDG6349282.1 outer membrane protein assembly factor BamE [Luteimonas sp. 8-5]
MRLSFLLAAAIACTVAGCGILYKQPIYQGNLLDKAAVDQLQVGMSRQQVQVLLGTPSIADPFHHDRWDYTATQRTDRVGTVHVKNLTVWFENDAVTRWEGDYFQEQDQELAQRMGRFGNLPKDDKKKR